eukprot:CAMPEP_0184481132 /NCGR_PEP_ID=MMETSP0113_2-20130426/2674_1 /TAXON_ID=91329 /ORGANISM="Norrisiella sphaerica, Strain BC52" /LENGTH=188 /DNA_ID=CAMNT_0026860061 /DNA_START=20 /DNA_END=586 /DNA_ORIENTATION=-
MSDGASAATTYRVKAPAYLKITAHAVKYALRPVCGVLLGREESGDVVVEDAIPLFHNYPLGPMLELALMQVDEFSKEAKTEIVGCYWANELADDMSVHRIAKRIGTQIVKFFKNAGILVVNNETLGKAVEGTISAFTPTNEGKCVVSISDSESLEKRISGKQLAEIPIVDFDEHLANVKLDWLHQKVV